MKRVIDFYDIEDSADVYDGLEKELDLPSFFGRNQDALYDVITGYIELPLELEFVNMDLIQLEEFEGILAVLTEAAESTEGFSFVFSIRTPEGFGPFDAL